MSPRGTRPSPYAVLHVAIAVIGVAVAYATGRYALVLVLLALTAAGRTLGLGRIWERLPFVVRFGFLK